MNISSIETRGHVCGIGQPCLFTDISALPPTCLRPVVLCLRCLPARGSRRLQLVFGAFAFVETLQRARSAPQNRRLAPAFSGSQALDERNRRAGLPTAPPVVIPATRKKMSLFRVLVAAACVLSAPTWAQLVFPGSSEGSSAPEDATPSASPAADAPAGPQGQTRFFPDLLGIFDPCQRCSPRDPVEASRCCQSGNRQCCSFVQPGGFGPAPFPPPFGGFPGQAGGFPGQQGGFIGQPGGFPGGPVVGPPGFAGGKPGACPFVNNAQSGFNRFAQTTSCVTECQSDSQCGGIQKCCAVGCSSICRNPAGAGASSPLIVPTPTNKPGFCPRPLGPLGELGTLFGLRSGAAGGAGATRSLAADEPEATAAEGSDRREDRRQARKERRERQKRSPQAPDRDDRRERRLNRAERVRGRVTRQAGEPDQRFLLPNLSNLPNPFCRDECFNDFDCLGNLKCCIKDNCRSCTNPSFF